MTEQTETERNEAIEILKQIRYRSAEVVDRCSRISTALNQPTITIAHNNVVALSLAISALKQQSEAERKIEKAREYCKSYCKKAGEIHRYYDGFEKREVIARVDTLTGILEILESNKNDG